MDYTNPTLPIAWMVSKRPQRHLQTIKVTLLNKADLPLNTGTSASRFAQPRYNGTVQEKKNLEYSIWRNESKIKKEKRPDLLHSRQEKIKELKMELVEVDRLLG